MNQKKDTQASEARGTRQESEAATHTTLKASYQYYTSSLSITSSLLKLFLHFDALTHRLCCDTVVTVDQFGIIIDTSQRSQSNQAKRIKHWSVFRLSYLNHQQPSALYTSTSTTYKAKQKNTRLKTQTHIHHTQIYHPIIIVVIHNNSD